MAEGQGRSSQQGVKLLYIRDYLRKYTDKEHPKSASKIAEYLASKGIKADHKTINSNTIGERENPSSKICLLYNPKCTQQSRRRKAFRWGSTSVFSS